MPNDLKELAERCEKASGPDRELDRDIELAFPYADASHLKFGLPQYTGGIDWVKTLVPEGCAWILYSDGPNYRAGAEIGPHPVGGELMWRLYSLQTRATLAGISLRRAVSLEAAPAWSSRRPNARTCFRRSR